MAGKLGPLSEGLLGTLHAARVRELGPLVAEKRESEFRVRRRHIESKARASELFDRIQQGDADEGAIHDAMNAGPFQSAFEYKGRMLREASVLHMALWMEATQGRKYPGLVRRLVEARIDIQQRAVYESRNEHGETFVTSLHSIVVASGLGKVELLDVVAGGIEEDLHLFLNRKDLAVKNEQYFYCPLHDACFLGNSHAIVWLISKGADPEKENSEHMTGLHMFVAAGAYEGTDDDIKKQAMKKLVASGAPLTKRAFDRRHKKSLTPIEMATGHDATFPKKLIYLLSPACHAIRKHKPKERSVNSSGDLSIIDDLLTLAKTGAKAADELANEIFTAETGRKDRARDQLMQDVQNKDANAVLKLASVMCAAPNAAAEILAVLTGPPKIQDPSHYPLRNRTSLMNWGDLGKAVNLRGAYSADALQGRIGLLEPTWFYSTRDHSHPKWHDRLIPLQDDVTYRQSMYDVQTSVVMVPDLLTVDMVQALANIQEIAVFQRLAITGIVTCLWNAFAYSVHSLEIVSLVVFELCPLLGWGMSVGENGEVFDRLWRTSTAENKDLSHNSPASVPFIWSVLAGVWLKNATQFIFWNVAHMHRWCVTQDHDPFGGFPMLQRFFHFPHTTGNYTNTGIWRIGQLVHIDNIPFYFLKLFLLGSLMWDTAGFEGCDSHGTICHSSQAKLAANISLCVVQMIYSLRSLTACGPRVLAIVSSFASGAMFEMMFIMAFCYMAFIWVLATLQRGHSVGWESIYLYRGLIFGDGDGLDRLGITSEKKDDDTGDPEQHSWITLYGVIFTLVFNIVFMNLIIAIYGDEYKEQQRKADLMFLKTRSASIAKQMLKYHSLGQWLPRALFFDLWIGFLVVWIVAVFVADDTPCYLTCFGSALFFALWETTFFVWVSHLHFAPHNSVLKKSGVECSVVGAALASQKMLEVRVAIRCQSEPTQEVAQQWRTALMSSNLRADSRKFDGFKPVVLHPRPPLLVIDDQIVSDAAGQGRYYEATLGFVIQSHHTSVLTYSFTTPTGKHGSVQFLVPRFLWVCYREDFNEKRYSEAGDKQ